MKPVWYIAKREVVSFFVSPVAYVVLTVWLLWQGISLLFFANIFASQQFQQGGVTQTPLTMFFGGSILFYVALIVVTPLLTMRLFAQERRTGTLESLLTTPVNEVQVVLGKYAASMVFWFALWLPTGLYVLIIGQFGSVDTGVLTSSYIGVLGIGAYYMALGLLMSLMAKSQITSAILTFMMIGGLFLLGLGSFVFDGMTQDLLGYLSVWTHMEDFSRGIVDSRRLVFDLSVTVFALWLAVVVLRWRRIVA